LGRSSWTARSAIDTNARRQVARLLDELEATPEPS
jgi:hypothetical protein